MDMKFYICRHCGNIIMKLKDSGVPVVCCGEKMAELIPGTSDGSAEKHVPVYQVEGNKVAVTVGAAEHPMTEAHYIQWIALQTKAGSQFKTLLPGQAPSACFTLCGEDEVEAVYAYCNLHGLWRA